MKPHSRFAAPAILILVITIAALFACPALAQEELLQNSGFESASSGVPDIWKSYNGNSTQVTEPVHEESGGSFAAKLAVTPGSAGWIYQVVAVSPGSAYTLSGWASKDPDDIYTRVYLKTSWYESDDGFGAEISHIVTPYLGNEPGYHFLTTNEVIAPLKSHSARVTALLDSRDETADVAFFDDLSFVGMISTPTPVPTPTPTPTPMLTPTPTVTVTPTPTPEPTQTPTPTPIPTPANEGDIVINELQYDPIQGGNDAAFEWLELYNLTGQTIELTGWRISDNHGVDQIPELLIPVEGFAVIAASPDFYNNFPDFVGNIVFISDGSIGNGLSNSGDRLILVDPTGKIIDALSYGDDTSVMLPSCPDVAEGHALERQPAGLDTDQASDFWDNESPSPGYGLELLVPTPTLQPTSTPTTIPTLTPTPTAIPTPAATATPTATPTPAATATPTITYTPAFTPIATPMSSPTSTPSPSPYAYSGSSDSWLYVVIAFILLLIGIGLLVANFRLKKRS